jgi:hypothetical protein
MSVECKLNYTDKKKLQAPAVLSMGMNAGRRRIGYIPGACLDGVRQENVSCLSRDSKPGPSRYYIVVSTTQNPGS